MDYYMTEDPATLMWLASVIETALANGQKVRIAVQGNDLQIKRGEGIWSPPLHSQPDPYRDLRTERKTTPPSDRRPDWWYRTEVPWNY